MERSTVMKIGSLFTGAGMLDHAVENVFDAHTVWYSEIDPNASKLLAYQFPHLPNLGDITKVDWSSVEPVDILCVGFPCQDVSAAGKQAGLQDGTRSGLWSVFAEAIDALRPRIVVIENVKGLLSAKATRSAHLESDGSGVGNTDRPLRAIGAVLGDLSERGYTARWCTVPASEAGAPHRRERVFIVATVSNP
jgi:DNA (cytosine-5)-methyltransferase 1